MNCNAYGAMGLTTAWTTRPFRLGAKRATRGLPVGEGMRGKAAKHTLFTVGHSTRALDELVAILRAHGVGAVADVRLIPKSRRYPQFNAGIRNTPHARGRLRAVRSAVAVVRNTPACARKTQHL